MPAGLEILRLRGGITLGTHGEGATENVLEICSKDSCSEHFPASPSGQPLQPAQESCVCLWVCTGVVMSETNGEDVFLH